MNAKQNARAWPIARLLFTTHLPFLVAMWVVLAVFTAVLVAGVAAFRPITSSGWDVAGSIVRWFAAGYGFYLTYELLPICIAHGQTRREFMTQATLFIVVTTAVYAVLVALGYLLESAAYGALGWQQQLSDQRLFTSAGEFGLIFLTFWVLLLIWTIAGALLAAAFYRSDGWGVLAIPLVVLLVLAAAFSVGYSALPFVDTHIGVPDISLTVSVVLGGAAFLLGLASTWAAVRDIPVRN